MPDSLPRRAFLTGAAALGAQSIAAPSIADTDVVTPLTAEIAPPTPVVLLSRGVSGAARARLAPLGEKIAFTDNIADAHVVFGGIGAGDFARAKNLRWVQFGAAGVEELLFPEFVASPVILTNAKGCYAPPIAEHVFGLLFALTRGIAEQARLNTQKRWNRTMNHVELSGKTMGIVGFGGIGRETARRANAMDLTVLAADIQPFTPQQIGHLAEKTYLVDNGGLEAMLGRSDIVVMACPHTRRSERMMNAARFAAMKDGTWFINPARGMLVDNDAMINALRSGKLAGAGLDATDPEPLNADSPLWTLPNVIVTSHTAGVSPGSQQRIQDVFVENVARFAAGLPLLNQVDKQAGF